MNVEINKELITNYFSGRATTFQKQMIEEWAKDPENREEFFKWLQEWEHHNSQYFPDVEMGLARHWERVQKGEALHEDTAMGGSMQEERRGRQFRLVSHWMVAATVALVLVGMGWLFRDHLKYRYYSTDFSETQRITLSDGSKVVLNSNSELRIPRFGFGKNTREVFLEGEANFDIVHTRSNQRFIVKTSRRLEVEVLGTQFNVYSRSRGEKVVLNKGKVALRYPEGKEQKELTMQPGDLVVRDELGRANLSKTPNPERFSAWKAHRFVFDKTTLREVGYLFEDNFGVQVQIPDSTLASLTISGSFTALDAEELLEILTEDSGLNYRKTESGKTIILSY